MSSTNKTTHYNLSQFIGTDKPAWLTDYNADMNKIDTGINSAQSTATGADGKADSANTAIGLLTNLTTTAKTNLVSAVNEVDANADTAQATATTANTNAASALAVANAVKDKFNLSNNSTYTSANISVTGGNITVGNGTLYIATNSDGSLFKVYGKINYIPNTTSTSTIRLANANITTTTPYTITGAGMIWYNEHSRNVHNVVNLTVNNGYIEISNIPTVDNVTGITMSLTLYPCLYINDNFGDIPSDE